jgi:hypothetical protein
VKNRAVFESRIAAFQPMSGGGFGRIQPLAQDRETAPALRICDLLWMNFA